MAGPKDNGGANLPSRPAKISFAEWTYTTSVVANWVLDRHFATKDFCRAIQEN
jgi:hypothetical protein